MFDASIENSYYMDIKPLIFDLGNNEIRAEGICGKCAYKDIIYNEYGSDSIENLTKLIRGYIAKNS